MADFLYCLCRMIWFSILYKMRAYIISIISIVFLAGNAAWAGPCDDLDIATCKTTAGCGWDSAGLCKSCSDSQYSTNTMQNCANCTNKPSSNGTFNYGTKANNESNTCPWTGSCNENYYWDGGSCKKCDSYYHTSGQPTISFAGGTSALPSAQNTCTGNVYEITLTKNLTNFLEDPKTVWVKYGSGFADRKDATSWRANPDKTPTYTWWQEFNGYSDSKNSKSLWIDSTGKLTNGKTNTSFKRDIELFGQWKGKNFTVTYYNSDGKTENQTQTCATDPNKDDTYTTCTALAYKGTLSGQYLKNWNCISGCTQSQVAPGEILPISNSAVSSGVKLVAVTESCPAGYYCPSDKADPQPCPYGSTSDKSSTTKSACFIETNTKFCDNKGCFQIPNGVSATGATTSRFPAN